MNFKDKIRKTLCHRYCNADRVEKSLKNIKV